MPTQPKAIKFDAPVNYDGGKYRYIRFFGDNGAELASHRIRGRTGSMFFYNVPIFEEMGEVRKEIEAGYELIGIRLYTNTNGLWFNFLLWPSAQEIY